MGFFSGLQSTYKKSEAAVIVQNLLDLQVKAGLFDRDPAKLANKFVAVVWEATPDVFNGRFGQRPHRIIVAACALANATMLFEEDDRNRSAIILALGNILSEININGHFYNLNSLDFKLLERSASIFASFELKFSRSARATELAMLIGS